MFGLLFCKVSTFISHLAIAASVTTMLAIAIERFEMCTDDVALIINMITSMESFSRYLAISCPTRKMKSLTLSLAILSIWTISSLVACPSLLFSTTETYHDDEAEDDTATACLLVWPDGPSYASFMDHVYQVVFLLMTYILPLLGLSITYTYLSRTLWRLQWQSSIISNQDNDRRAKKEMRKVAKMFIVILIIFGVCWLPYHVYFVVLFYYPVSNTRPSLSSENMIITVLSIFSTSPAIPTLSTYF